MTINFFPEAKKRWSNRRGGVKTLPPRLGLPTNTADNPDGPRWSEGPRYANNKLN